MDTNVIEKLTDATRQVAHLDHLSRASALVGDAVEDGKRKARRALKRSYVAAEDCLEDTTYYIRHHPWQSVSIALGVGAGVGVLAGWLYSRNCRS
jgi:ElaB/YqjD/DUF883 family membrane-anchored ribosome-binding protein